MAGILVRATQEGHYGEKYRMAGDEFEITDDKAFSKRWMERVHAPAKKAEVKAADPVAATKKKPTKKAAEKPAE